MLFKACNFKVVTNTIPKEKRRFPSDGDQTTHVFLSESEIPDEDIMNTLCGGQSPRVRYQASWRKNGIPKELKLPAMKWVGTPDKILLDMSEDEMSNRAKNDPDFRRMMLRSLGLDDGGATPEDNKG